MIQGVQLKKLKALRDDRGFLMEILRSDDQIFERFGQAYITGCKMGVAKAWHYHKLQTDNFTCISGETTVVLYDMREDSPTKGELEEYVLQSPSLSDSQPMLLQIPPLVVHGFTARTGPEAIILNIPTQTYRYHDPDEHRFPWNSEIIPYDWSPEIKTGG